MYINVKVAVLLGSVAGAVAEALEKAAGAQTRPARSSTGTVLRGGGGGDPREGRGGKRERSRRRNGVKYREKTHKQPKRG